MWLVFAWLAFGAVAQGFVFAGPRAEKPEGSADSALRYRGSAEQRTRAAGAGKPERDLHHIGVLLAKAVVDRNIETLLAYDREDLRAANAESLKNNNSDLYCYLFDSDCITWGDGTWRSVYDKLSQARKLEIRATLTSSPYDRQLYGSLLFYDGAAFSDKDLRSPDFLCKQAPAGFASWKFRYERGKWKAVTPLFDSEARNCPSDVTAQ